MFFHPWAKLPVKVHAHVHIVCATVSTIMDTHQFVGAPGNPLPALGSNKACLCHDSIAHWSRSSFWRSISVTVAPFRSISFRNSESRNSLRFATALHHLERSLEEEEEEEEERGKKKEGRDKKRKRRRGRRGWILALVELYCHSAQHTSQCHALDMSPTVHRSGSGGRCFQWRWTWLVHTLGERFRHPPSG